MAPVLVMIGYWIARTSIRFSVVQALAALAVTYALVVTEEALIARLSGSSFTSHNFVLSTFPMGASIFLLALSLAKSQNLVALARLGAVSLGVYASHLAFLRLLQPYFEQGTFLGACLYALAATLSATILSLLLSRSTLTQHLAR